MTQRSRILVIDNEPSFSKLLLMLLGTHGYQVEAVATGEEALDRANGSTELILLDMPLADYNAFRTCRLLKSDTHTRHIPLMVLSGRSPNGDQVEDANLGADDYLYKPFEPEQLLQHIEGVLQHDHLLVKGNGHASHSSYDTIHELRDIMDHGSIVPYFQPIYCLQPLRLFGLEVLSRPQTTGKLSDPQEMFKAALHYGVYYELEMIVWNKAIAMAKQVFDQEHLFLNCSPHLIESDRFESVKEIFCEQGMEARHVFLELTERSAINEHDKFFQRLAHYRRHGFKIAIDDVGAGYSSLEAIMQTKPEVVKIDRQIVCGLAEDSFKRSITKLVVAFCLENGIICIAEGIETKRDLDILIDMGVQMGQGYYLHKPVGHIDLDAMRAILT